MSWFHRNSLDLEKFFDRMNHDVLMSRVSRQVHDARAEVDPPGLEDGPGE